MIIQKLQKYDFSACIFTSRPHALQNGFLIRFRLGSPVTERTETELFCISDAVRATARLMTIDEAGQGWGWNENYTSYPDENGYVPVLETEIYLNVPYHPERTAMKIGIPLTLYNAVEQDIVLMYDGLHLWLCMDGEVVNENFPIGTIRNTANDPTLRTTSKLASLAFSEDLAAIKTIPYEKTMDCGIRYYSPAGHNTWAGDVVNFWHDGTYHLIYFYDRHHHGNRFGGGAHYFRQLTTTDFKNWTDHGPIFELAEPWQSVGTGTMFYWRGKYYFAYGFHTGRNIPEEHLFGSELIRRYREDGYTMAVPYDEIMREGKYPNGANLAVSNDGISFRVMGEMFHWEENPSVYTKEDGGLFMCVGDGIWESDTPKGKWQQTKPGFPPCGTRSVMRNSAECPSFFAKNGYRYIIMGLTGFWRTEKDSETYFDSAAMGYDIYDGLLVPMAVNCDGRLILAGWLNGIGWGSVIVHRELLQHEDGSLGMRWLPEDEIDTITQIPVIDNCAVTDGQTSYYWEIDVHPGDGGVLAVTFGDNCTLRIDTIHREVQIADPDMERVPPIHERIHEIPADVVNPWLFHDTHIETHNFSIANVRGLDSPFKVRILTHFERKMNATLIDAEIAGERTIISNRVGAKIHTVSAITTDSAKITRIEGYTV